jgi:hypothetical protein
MKKINSIPKKANVNIITIVLIFTSLSSIILFVPPVSASHQVGTFECDYITPKTTFMQGEIVYGKGTDTCQQYFKLRILDPDDNIMFTSDPLCGTQITCLFVLDDNVSVGQWHIQLGIRYECSWDWSIESGRIAAFNVIAADEDNDGYSDSDEVACGSDPLNACSVPDDFDGDFNPDCVDTDDDNDGVPDDEDAFPYDPTETDDTDGDGIGDNADSDDDNDGVPDDEDAFPYDPTKSSEEPGNPPIISKQSTRSHFTNIAPVANANGPYYATINEEIEFNGSASYDSDGFILHYSWSFGDGETSVGEIVTHHYTLPGFYQITLKVTDNLGVSNTNVTNASIIIPNRPPSQPILLGPTNGIINTKYSYAFKSSDADNDQITYIVDWGDGSTFETEFKQNSQYISKFHQWNSSGNYTITITASDTKSTTSSEMIVTIQDTLIVDNITIILLGILALFALLVILLYSKKREKSE